MSIVTQLKHSIGVLIAYIIYAVPITTFLVSRHQAIAQVTPDNTLPTNSLVSVDGDTLIIEGGTQAGSNLFHSFTEFSVITDNVVLFNNFPEIQNIISRVTGNSISNIDGTIAANDFANLFLINPNGIVFGANAQLNISGSFLASTAESITFSDGNEFSATEANEPPLLKINIPLGVQFGNQPAAIEVNGSFLEVFPGETLALVGGDITIAGALLAAQQGRIELGSIADNSLVSINPNVIGFTLDYAENENFGIIKLSDFAFLDASGVGGGSIQVYGGIVTLTEEAGIVANTEELEDGGEIFIQAEQLIIREGAFVDTSTSGEGNGGTLTVQASESIEISGVTADGAFPSGLFSETEGAGKAGNLNITTERLTIQDGAQVSVSTFGDGQGGNLTVTASELLEITSSSEDGFFPSGLFANTEGLGNGGNLDLITNQLIVQQGAEISAFTFAMGNAGKISIQASDFVQVTGSSGNLFSGITAQVAQESTGVGGTVTINTPQLIVNEQGRISSLTAGEGAGGNVNIAVEQLQIDSGGQILTLTVGTGKGGILTINASDKIELTGTDVDGFPSGLFTQSQGILNDSDAGDAGDLSITTNSLTVREGAAISADTLATGKGGTITIEASQLLELIGVSPGQFAMDTSPAIRADGRLPSRITAFTTASGSAGDIILSSEQINLRDGATIAAQGTQVTGIAGSLAITANSLNLENDSSITVSNPLGQAGNTIVSVDALSLNQGTITAETGLSGNGEAANITLQVSGVLSIANESLISATALEDANGGNVTINGGFLVAFPSTGDFGSDIAANAFRGDGGRVNITADGVVGIEFQDNPTSGNDITVTSVEGSAGIVELNTPDTNPAEGIPNLPVDTVDNQPLASCQTTGGQSTASLVDKGRGGSPPNPYEPLSNGDIWEDVQPTQVAQNNSEQIVEAQGWQINERGNLELVAAAHSEISCSSR